MPQRKYQDGDIVEFDFKPDNWSDVPLIGMIDAISYNDDGIRYRIQLRDNKRKIFGDLSVPEKQIKRKLEEEEM